MARNPGEVIGTPYEAIGFSEAKEKTSTRVARVGKKISELERTSVLTFYSRFSEPEISLYLSSLGFVLSFENVTPSRLIAVSHF